MKKWAVLGSALVLVPAVVALATLDTDRNQTNSDNATSENTVANAGCNPKEEVCCKDGEDWYHVDDELGGEICRDDGSWGRGRS